MFAALYAVRCVLFGPCRLKLGGPVEVFPFILSFTHLLPHPTVHPSIHPSTYPSFCSSRAESGCPSSRIFGLQQVVSAHLLFFLCLGLKKKKKEKKRNKLSDVICDNLVCVCAHIATFFVTKVFLLNAIKNIYINDCKK